MYALMYEMQPIFTSAMQEAWRGAFKFELTSPGGPKQQRVAAQASSMPEVHE
jgi:hypothetical protein